MKLRLLLTPFIAFLVGIVSSPLSHAETQVLTTEATYIMGDGESPSFAEAQALQRAKQIALEQAGTYVESYTKVRNYDLTAEEIQTLAGGVIQVEVLERTRTLVSDGLRFYIKIKATVTTDKMEELAQRIKGKNVAQEYKILQAEYARLSKDIATWKQLLLSKPPGQERDTALDQIREREKDFALVQKSEVALYQRLISGEALVAQALDNKGIVDNLIETIRTKGHVVELGQMTSHPGPISQHDEQVILIMPVVVDVSTVLPSLITEASAALGGKGFGDAHEATTGGTYSTSMLKSENALGSAGRHRTGQQFRLLTEGGRQIVTSARWKYFQLSNDPYIEAYFQDRLQDMFLVTTFLFENGTRYSCTLPSIINRVFPAHIYRDGEGRMFFPPGRNFSDGRGGNRFYSTVLEPLTKSYRRTGVYSDTSREPTNVPVPNIILLEKTMFDIELRFPQKNVASLKRVIAGFEDKQRATKEACRLLLID